jgi:PBSX family phage terminase large subunit
MTAPTTTVRVQLRGAARELLKRREAEVLICGPAGTGKSYAALWKMHLMCLKNPGLYALIVRKTHKSLTSTGLVTFREKVAKEAIEAGLLKWYGGSGEKPAQYVYENGSAIVVGGMDNADKIMSADYDVIFVQEATDLTPDDWEKLTSRLDRGASLSAVSFSQILADCNPQQPKHWLKERCDQGKTVMLYGRHQDNPSLYDDDGVITERGQRYMERLGNLTGVRKERLLHGRWAAADGLIYGDWDPAVHMIDRKTMPREWTRIWTVDFGFTHPFVWQMWAVDPDGRLYLEREIHRTQTLVEDHAKEILRIVRRKGNGKDPNEWVFPKPRAIICDHDAEDRATLERHLGMGTVAARKSVSDGLQAFAARLRPAKDGKPRLFVCRDALTSRDEEAGQAGRPLWFGDEIEGYVWEPGLDGKPAKERPLKDNDDSMDAARYAVAYFDLTTKARLRWVN